MTRSSPPRVHSITEERAHRAGSQRRAPGSDRTTILVVDRDRLFADTISAVLNQRAAYSIVSAASGNEALRYVVEFRPAIALVSLDVADVTATEGIPLANRILGEAPETIVLGMVNSREGPVAARATELGLQGVLSTDDSVARFIRRIEDALRREGTEIQPPKARRPARSRGRRGADALAVRDLTSREVDVLELLVQSLSGREIAERLGISRNTVRSHMQSIFHKLHVHSRLEAAAFAVKGGMFEPPLAEGKTGGEQNMGRERSA